MDKLLLQTKSNQITSNNSNARYKVPAIMQQQLLYNIFMESPAMLCVLKGPDHIFELANEPFRQFTGKQNLIGKTLKEVLPELEGQGFLELLDNVYTTGEPFTGKEMPILVNGKNGTKEEFFLNFNYQSFYDAPEDIKGISVFAYDVTEQVTAGNKIKESESKYRGLVYGLPTAFYTCDAEGYIQLYNEAAVQLWGRIPEVGKDLWCGSWQIYKVDGSSLPLDECPMALVLKEGRVSNMEIVIKRPDGTRRNVIPYPQAVYNSKGKITGAVNTLIDITEQVTAHRQIEQIAEMVQILYMNAPAFVATVKGPEFVYELVNPEYQKLYGSQNLLNKKVIDAHPELKGTGILELLNKVYKTGVPFVATESLLYLSRDEGKEPEPTYLNFSYQPMYTIDKEIEGVLVFGYEVTEQVLAKKKGEENLKWILESLPQITSVSSATGTNIFFNRFFFEYSGLSKEEATNNGWNSIVHPDEIGKVLSHWEKCKEKGEDFYKELRLKRKSDGMYRWHVAHINPIKNKNGEITQWIASATDIHEQKTKEQKKDEFISIASHEMKTPLTTAKAYLQLLEFSMDNKNEKVNGYAKKAILAVDRLKDLISELLDVSQIQNGKLNYNFTLFDFNQMLDDSIEGVQFNSCKHKIIKTDEIPEPVYGDKERLQQVAINLLSNAIKYSPDLTDIFINVALEEDEIKVSVKDHGIGIAPENLEKIFERYYRIEGQEILFQGLGIGLFISMEIIQRHHGKLWAESDPGNGSTFYFTLPVKV